jgi:HPt (histidine-containing phosphotransfer) domain-containing protein
MDVPIIALTADSAMGARERFREVGVDDVVIKPVRRSTLLPALARCLSQSLPQPADSVPPPKQQAGETGKPLPMDFESAVTEFGSDQIVNGVAAHFVADLERQTALMKQALEARDLETLCRNSHSIKGGAGTLIARPLAESALHLERLSRTGAGRDQLASALANLIQETERLKAFLFIRSAQNSTERTAGRTVS